MPLRSLFLRYRCRRRTVLQFVDQIQAGLALGGAERSVLCCAGEQ
jgi:hypothetical protein